MAAPTINAINSIAQGTGGIVKQSVIEIRLNFTLAGATADFTCELSVDGGTNWYQTVMNSAATGVGLAQNANALLTIDVAATYTLNKLAGGSNGTLTPGSSNALVRLRAKNTTTNETSADTTSGSFALKSTSPGISSVAMAQYVGASAANTPYTVTSVDAGNATKPSFFRSALGVSEIQPTGGAAWQNWTSATTTQNASFNFGSEPEGSGKTIYVRTYDQFYNASQIASVTTYLQKTPPTRAVLRLTGSSGSSDYTGITINPDGSFSPDRTVTLRVSARSPIPMTFQVRTTSDMEATTNGGSPAADTALGSSITYQTTDLSGNMVVTVDNLVQVGKVTTNKANSAADNFNVDASVTVAVRFIDAAGNTTDVSKTIRLNTRIYQTSYKPMWPADSTYQPILKYLNTGGAEVLVPRTLILQDQVTRAWPDIFYPATHGYPINATTGAIDTAFILADASLSNMVSTVSYDAVKIQTDNSTQVKSLVLDSDGRPIIANWTVNGTKNYPNMTSSSVGNLTYWIIDNQNYGDFQVQFEWFDLDSGVYGPPYNPQAPYKGDVLVMYDATAPGALDLTTDQDGNEVYVLNDPTKLVEIAAFTGTGTNVVNMTSGLRMNSGQNGDFTTDFIRNTRQICFIMYSDTTRTSSGFKVKSGPSHQVVWYNYDVDEKNGRIWVHMHETIANTGIRGAADSTTKRLQYDYMDEDITRDFENGTITFGTAQTGKVTADYSFYTGNTFLSNTFLATWDDFVDYNEVATHVLPSGLALPTSAVKNQIFEVDGQGRLMQKNTWDKDRGVLEVDQALVDTLVGRRLFADYYHHTYLRLTNDGYGDLVFRDKVLVADTTPVYPDYTFQDVKIVNEGDALLEDMKVKFVPRGYDTNNDGQVVLEGVSVVDQVLDINRPWDIQRGTKEETYNVMAMALSYTYIFTRSCPKSGGNGFTGDSGATAILGAWNDRVFGDMSPRSQAFGRAVWVLGGTGGTSYPTTTAGPKRTSIEASGKYYSTIVT